MCKAGIFKGRFYICTDCAKENGGELVFNPIWYIHERCQACEQVKEVSKSNFWTGLEGLEKRLKK